MVTFGCHRAHRYHHYPQWCVMKGAAPWHPPEAWTQQLSLHLVQNSPVKQTIIMQKKHYILENPHWL